MKNQSPRQAGSDSTSWKVWATGCGELATHIAIFHRTGGSFKQYYVGRPPVEALKAVMRAATPPLTSVELCEWDLQNGEWVVVLEGL